MSNIKEILKIPVGNKTWSYLGFLRNGKRFNLEDTVFFALNDGRIFRGVIVGIELPPVMNPEYLYKIRLPEELVHENLSSSNKEETDSNLKHIVMNCDHIFNNVEEAESSALQANINTFELSTEKIKSYFNQFK